MAEFEGVMNALEREDWHCALVGIDKAVQARVRAPVQPHVCEVVAAEGGWQAVVKWPDIRC